MTEEHSTGGAQPVEDEPPSVPSRAIDGRRMSLLSLAVFDVGGPLAVYYGLRSAGSSSVVALVVSGVLPAVGIGLAARRHRRIDAVGVVVLLGILVGTVVGLASGSARLVLLDGTVPTAVLGVACFGSLATSRPLMFRVAHQFMGPESERGRQFESMWQHPRFRHAFAVITVMWGAAFLAETVAQIVIIQLASTGTAKTTSNLMPLAVVAIMMAWMTIYGRRQQARADREPIAWAVEASASPTAPEVPLATAEP